MPNLTDQNAAAPEARVDAFTAAVLVAVGEHFRTENPTVVLERVSLLACVGAAAYDLVDRKVAGDAPALYRAAMAVMPERREDVTRGEYTLLIRDVVVTAGHDWPDGDNDRAIPRITGIPAPRAPIPVRVPIQPGPEQSGAPMCCGRSMRRDGGQWVCGKCRGWSDTGRAALVLVPALVEGATV